MMKYNYNKDEAYLYILDMFETDSKEAPITESCYKIRVPPKTLEPLDESNIIKGLRILSD